MRAVHGGASLSASPASVQICAEAVKHKSVVEIVSVLEDSPKFNCGYGSNLTSSGEVECEAGYMSTDQMRFGAVGAMTGVRFPSKVAFALANDNGISGLVPPQFIVGAGAFEYAEKKGLTISNPSKLVSRHASSVWRNAKDSIEKSSAEAELANFGKLDTVGAVAIQDTLAESCTSSGGMVLKHPGRLGHSAVFGSGTWVDYDAANEMLVAASVSGCGEALVRTNFCRSLVAAILKRDTESEMPSDVVKRWFKDSFLNASTVQNIEESRRLAGGIILIKEGSHYELIIFHNTPYLPVAYSLGKKSNAYLSKLAGENFKCDVFSV